ncbi:MAG TPA: carbohydrate kinase family protein [Aggregatilinea sp.]|uniref:carbohydrate kinase family protein n=1 Tax=Aggregatilinea sp. TaxID=2806333 RepID=UPI002BF49035|nr:carbohydrate kinase family protein [Aggregatilinea sp.]HML23894.1 carbohydrate kinase family protein [Aggregatilinea sp.]
MRIVVSGSIAFDYLMRFPGRFSDHLIADKLDRISISLLVETLDKQRGGTAANIAYSLALLGERPILMGTAGMDFAEYRAWLDEHGVDTSAVRIIPGVFTASFFANTDSENNQIGSFYTGAMAYSNGYKLAEAVTSHPDLMIISPNDPAAMSQLADECAVSSVPFIFDPSQQVVWLDGDFIMHGIERCSILICNEYEWEMIAKKTGLKREDVVRQGKTLLVTHGSEGSHIYADDEHLVVPIFPVTTIADPTGVGDAYRAGLMKGLACGFGWELCGQIGALAAAYALEHVGPQSHDYTLPDFVARFRTVFDDHGALDGWLQPGTRHGEAIR